MLTSVRPGKRSGMGHHTEANQYLSDTSSCGAEGTQLLSQDARGAISELHGVPDPSTELRCSQPCDRLVVATCRVLRESDEVASRGLVAAQQR